MINYGIGVRVLRDIKIFKVDLDVYESDD